MSSPFVADADVAAAAALIGEPPRAALLLALTEVDYLPARELAAKAGVAPSGSACSRPTMRAATASARMGSASAAGRRGIERTFGIVWQSG